jgi:hypothetical protein
VTPDHVLEHVAHVDGPRLRNALLLPLDREPVSSQPDRAAEPVAERLEDAVTDAGELRGDIVRNGQDFLHSPSV